MLRALVISSALSLTVGTAGVRAAEYHVSPRGDDANPGTVAAPWRSLAQANATLEAGDTVWIHAGTYPDSIRPANQGRSDSERIIYRAYGDGDVVLTGFPGLGGPAEGALALGERNYVTVSGRAVGDPPSARRIRLVPPEDVNSLGNVCGSEGVIVEHIHADCSDPNRSCNRGFGFCINFWEGDYETRFNILRHSTFIGGTDPGPDPTQFTEDLISIAHRAHHNLIENNELSICRHSTLYADSPTSHSNVIRGNRILNPQHTALSIWSAGVAWQEGARFLVENNWLSGSGATVQPDGGPGNALQWGSDELIIRHNVITQGGAADQQVTSIGGLMGATGTSFGSPYFATDGRIYHNAIVNNRGLAVGVFDFFFLPVDLGRHVFINNFFYGSSSAETGNLLGLYWDFDFATADRYLRNVWGNPGGSPADGVIQNAHQGLADLATAAAGWRNPRDPELSPRGGFENVYDPAPGFVDYPGADYRLAADSPYRDTAAPLTYVAAGDGGSGTTLRVEDARIFFAEAAEFPAWMGVEPEWIAIGASFETAARVQITAVDDSRGEVTLTTAVPRAAGDSVWIWRDSTGRQVIQGAGPDIGPFELQAALFEDGFESGNTSAWAVSTPSPGSAVHTNP